MARGGHSSRRRAPREARRLKWVAVRVGLAWRPPDMNGPAVGEPDSEAGEVVHFAAVCHPTAGECKPQWTAPTTAGAPGAAREQQPRVDEEATQGSQPYLSLVIPAYNEASRIAHTLGVVTTYLSAQPYTWEVLVVDDGSGDATLSTARAASCGTPGVRVLANPHRGKANAVRTGVLSARGKVIGFTDADLSTPIETLSAVLAHISEGFDLVIGSREGAGAFREGEPVHRHVMGRVFNAIVQVIALPGIQDSQCGFKFMRGRVAHDLFSGLLLYGAESRPPTGPAVTGFDVELLYLARARGLRVAQTPVTWRYVDTERVDPVLDSVRLLRDVLHVRWNALRGRYR